MIRYIYSIPVSIAHHTARNGNSHFAATKHWSRALPQGARPTGRYGHTLNILGSKIYIFGGQVEGFFFNDLVAFDLNSLQSSTSRWEVLLQNSKDQVSPQTRSPPARTNHSVVTWNDKLYLYVYTHVLTSRG
jgi:hypothetical protein